MAVGDLAYLDSDSESCGIYGGDFDSAGFQLVYFQHDRKIIIKDGGAHLPETSCLVT